MKSAILQAQLLAATITFFSVSFAPAAPFEWTGASGVDDLWATAANWNPSGPPGTADSPIFGETDTAGDATAVNNMVGASATVAALSYTNSTAGTWHVTEIPTGVTLTASGTVTIGGGTANNLSTSVAMAGGGTFLASGNTFTIGNAGADNPLTPGTLDLSNLTNFVYNASGGTIGIAAAGSRGMGTLTLAGVSNRITAGTININGATGTASSPRMNLGPGTNVLHVNTFNVGGGRSTTTLEFLGANGGLRLRGAGGTDSDRCTMVVGNRNTGGTSQKNTFGNVFLNGHPVDLRLSTLTLGLMSRSASGTDNGGYNPSGVFQFDQGTVDVTTINMGVCSGNSSNSSPIGTLTVGAAGVLWAGGISLANVSSPAVNCSATGTLNITGGVVNCSGNLAKTTALGSGNLIVTTGTLNMSPNRVIGTPAMPLDAVELSDVTLRLTPINDGTNAVATALTTGGGGNTIQIGSVPSITTYPKTFRLIKYQGAIGGSGYNFSLTGLPGVYTGSLMDNAANSSVDLVITSGPIAQALTWLGTPNGNWDILTTKNWRVGTTSTNYFDGDFATFNDTVGGTTAVNLAVDVSPGSITFNNSSANYSLGGGSKIGGLTGLTKLGSGSLLVNNSGVNDFSGSITVSGGTLQVGNGGTSGNLGGGAVNNSASLVFNRSDDLTVANLISGPASGLLTKSGAGVLTLSGANTFTGAVNVAAGTLKPANASALGQTNGATTVSSGATLDVNALNLGAEPVTVSGSGVGGNGAIINSGAQQLNALRYVTLAGNTVFGNPGRWDIRGAPSTADPANAALSTGGNPYTLTKVGTNQVSLVGVTVDAALGDVDVQQGTFAIETATTGLGNPANNLTVRAGATLNFFNTTNRLNKVITLNGSGTNNTVNAGDGVIGLNHVVGPMALNGECWMSVNGGDFMTFSNPITGGGGASFVKQGGGTLILSGPTKTYSGNTTLSNGTLLVNCTVNGGGTLTTMTNTTLSGTGTHTGPIVIGGALSPGTSAGTLTTGPLTLNSGAALTLELAGVNTIGSGVNDLIQVNGNLTVNNNPIAITLLGGSLQAANYRLFNYTGTLSGSFNPAVTVAGGATRTVLALQTGTLGQVDLNVSGSAGKLRWEGNLSGTWDIASAANWFNLGASASDVFYQLDSVLFDDTPAGVPPIEIPAGVAVSPSAMTNNSSANSYTIGGAGKISGAPAGLVKDGSSTLTLGTTNNDFTGGVRVRGGTVRLAAASAAGTGLITVNNGATVVLGGAHTNSISLAGATFGVDVADFVMGTGSELTIAASTFNTIQSSDPQNPITSRNIQVDGALRGSGTILIKNADGITSPDGNQGVRFRGTAASDFSGTIIVTNNSKSELRVAGPGPFSPAGTGKFILVCGAYNGGNALTAPDLGGYLEFNIRNNNAAGDTLIGNDIEFTGSGAVVMNQLSDGSGAPAGAVATLGNLKIGDGQEMIGYRGSGVAHALKFQTVTLTGGNATFSPKSSSFGAVGQTGGDFVLGPISQQVAGSGIIMNGLRTLTLTGVNTYSGNTVVSAGTLALTGSATIANSPNIQVDAGATLDVSGRTDGKLTLGSGQTLTGNGTLRGSLAIGAGATVSPGASVGALTVTNTVTLSGTTAMEIDKSAGTNDVIGGAISIAYGGILSLTSLTDPLADGDNIKLFDAAGYTGAFTSISPATPGTGLRWDTSTLTADGTLRVRTLGIDSVALVGPNLVLNGSGGISGKTFNVLASTDLSVPRVSWTVVSTGTIDSNGNFSASVPVSPSVPRRYYTIVQLP